LTFALTEVEDRSTGYIEVPPPWNYKKELQDSYPKYTSNYINYKTINYINYKTNYIKYKNN